MDPPCYAGRPDARPPGAARSTQSLSNRTGRAPESLACVMVSISVRAGPRFGSLARFADGCNPVARPRAGAGALAGIGCTPPPPGFVSALLGLAVLGLPRAGGPR
jgi:hypothetical protein